jgi:type II secretory pathway pseudopilin PulG
MKVQNKKGFLIIETLIAVVIFALVGLSLYSTMGFLQIRTQKSNYDTEAILLVQEGTEIAYKTLFSDWGGYPDNTYFAVFDSDANDWSLLPGEENGLHGRFAREIRLIQVCRDSSTGEHITKYEETGVCSGDIDANSRVIQTEVSWEESGEKKNIVARLVSYRVPEE